MKEKIFKFTIWILLLLIVRKSVNSSLKRSYYELFTIYVFLYLFYCSRKNWVMYFFLSLHTSYMTATKEYRLNYIFHTAEFRPIFLFYYSVCGNGIFFWNLEPFSLRVSFFSIFTIKKNYCKCHLIKTHMFSNFSFTYPLIHAFTVLCRCRRVAWMHIAHNSKLHT